VSRRFSKKPPATSHRRLPRRLARRRRRPVLPGRADDRAPVVRPRLREATALGIPRGARVWEYFAPCPASLVQGREGKEGEGGVVRVPGGPAGGDAGRSGCQSLHQIPTSCRAIYGASGAGLLEVVEIWLHRRRPSVRS
jgi:hypothetical protein